MRKLGKLCLSASIGSTLILAGCGGKSDGPSKSKISVPSSEALAKTVLNHKAKKVTGDADAALTQLGFSDASPFKWADKTVKGKTHTFKNITIEGVDAFKLDAIVIENPGQVNGKLSVDQIKFEGFSFAQQGEIEVNIKSIAMATPGSDLVEMISLSLTDPEAAEDFMERASDLSQFWATGMVVEEFEINVINEDVQMSMDYLTFGRDAKTKKGIMDLAGFKLTGEDNDMPINFRLGRMAVTGLDAVFIDMFKDLDITKFDLDPEGEIAKLTSAMYANVDVYRPMFKAIEMSDFYVSYDGIKAEMPSYTMGMTDNVKGVIRSFGKMDKFVFELGDSSDGDIQQAKEVLEAYGLDRMEFSLIQDCFGYEKEDRMYCPLEENGIFMKDEMGFNFAYDLTGYQALYSAMGKMTGDPSDVEEQMQAMMETMSLNKMIFKVTDKGIIDKIMNITAEEQGVSADVVRAQAKSGMAILSVMAQDDTQVEMITKFSKAVGSFIDDGGSLTLGMEPKEPLNMAIIEAMAENLDLDKLGIIIEHDK